MSLYQSSHRQLLAPRVSFEGGWLNRAARPTALLAGSIRSISGSNTEFGGSEQIQLGNLQRIKLRFFLGLARRELKFSSAEKLISRIEGELGLEKGESIRRKSEIEKSKLRQCASILEIVGAEKDAAVRDLCSRIYLLRNGSRNAEGIINEAQQALVTSTMGESDLSEGSKNSLLQAIALRLKFHSYVASELCANCLCKLGTVANPIAADLLSAVGWSYAYSSRRMLDVVFCIGGAKSPIFEAASQSAENLSLDEKVIRIRRLAVIADWLVQRSCFSEELRGAAKILLKTSLNKGIFDVHEDLLAGKVHKEGEFFIGNAIAGLIGPHAEATPELRRTWIKEQEELDRIMKLGGQSFSSGEKFTYESLMISFARYLLTLGKSADVKDASFRTLCTAYPDAPELTPFIESQVRQKQFSNIRFLKPDSDAYRRARVLVREHLGDSEAVFACVEDDLDHLKLVAEILKHECLPQLSELIDRGDHPTAQIEATLQMARFERRAWPYLRKIESLFRAEDKRGDGLSVRDAAAIALLAISKKEEHDSIITKAASRHLWDIVEGAVTSDDHLRVQTIRNKLEELDIHLENRAQGS